MEWPQLKHESNYMYCMTPLALVAGLSMPEWTFLTNHAHVLLSLASNADLRVRDMASQVGITERAVHRILSELEREGYIDRQREGRRTHYHLNRALRMRHPMEAHKRVADLIKLVRHA